MRCPARAASLTCTSRSRFDAGAPYCSSLALWRTIVSMCRVKRSKIASTPGASSRRRVNDPGSPVGCQPILGSLARMERAAVAHDQHALPSPADGFDLGAGPR